ncbi:MAG: GNAT family N-acetyltransferase [Actinomycetota bacterium]|nr:GNAT family N-acetyltransferase [Actinomycetota bacterium]
MTQIRPLVPDDVGPVQALSEEAFGPSLVGAEPPPLERSGRRRWGSFDRGRPVAHLAVRRYDSWWAGATVPTAGIASVTVAAERRGDGLLAGLLSVALDAERADGACVLSTLYPTATGIYRSLGYEVVTSYDIVDVPVAGLARLRPGAGITVRRAETGDVPALRAVYDTWAAAQRGPLTRRGPSFTATDTELLEAGTGTTLALDEDGAVVGYASWQRGPGYDGTAVITVNDLLATDDRAHAHLWSFFASFSSVVGTLRVRTSGVDAARRHLPGSMGTVTDSRPYMLRVDDVAAAVTALAPTGTARFAVVGDRLGVMDGTYAVADGGCRRLDDRPDPHVPTFSPRGLALAYAGVESSASLRLGGLLHGPEDDVALEACWGRRGAVHVRDYF